MLRASTADLSCDAELFLDERELTVCAAEADQAVARLEHLYLLQRGRMHLGAPAEFKVVSRY